MGAKSSKDEEVDVSENEEGSDYSDYEDESLSYQPTYETTFTRSQEKELEKGLRFFNPFLRQIFSSKYLLRNPSNAAIKELITQSLRLFTMPLTPIKGVYDSYSVRETFRAWMSALTLHSQQDQFEPLTGFLYRVLHTLYDEEHIQWIFKQGLWVFNKPLTKGDSDDPTPYLVLPEVMKTISQWWHESRKKTCLLSLNEVKAEGGVGHYTLAILQRQADGIMLLSYFSSTASSYAFEVSFVQAMAQLAPVKIVTRGEHCYTLQTYEQGGNCGWWSLIALCLFVQNPDYLPHAHWIYSEMQRHPNNTILLFELYLFFQFMTLMPDFRGVLAQTRGLNFRYDALVRELVNEEFSVVNCSIRNTEELCTKSTFCVYTDEKCQYKGLENLTWPQVVDLLQQQREQFVGQGFL
jgi:hypothetical protein